MKLFDWLRGVQRPRKRAVAGGAATITAVVALTVPIIGDFEGLRTSAYRDAVGVWTICYGETHGVQPGDSYTVAECDAMLAPRVREFAAGLRECIHHPLPVEVEAAFVSWAYNVGLGAACESTLVRLANAGDLRGACDQLPRWNRAGGRVLDGLTNRRLSERVLCLSGLPE